MSLVQCDDHCSLNFRRVTGNVKNVALSLVFFVVAARKNACPCSAEAEAGVSSDRSLVEAALSLALTLRMLRTAAPPPHVVQVRRPHLALSVTRQPPIHIARPLFPRPRPTVSDHYRFDSANMIFSHLYLTPTQNPLLNYSEM